MERQVDNYQQNALKILNDASHFDSFMTFAISKIKIALCYPK
ncbi:hypothetical protein [Clostridium estertheticum]|nr:hypothetical protein [Clostridium estertheticum]